MGCANGPSSIAWAPNLGGTTLDQLLHKIRTTCLGFPEAGEKETWGQPTFRVRDKIFATFGIDDEERATVTVKAPPGEQQILLATGDQFFYPSYVGSKGWIGVFLGEETDWEEIAELVEESYRMTAPKKLWQQLDA